MFDKLLLQLFPSFISAKAQPNYGFFEQDQQQQIEGITSSKAQTSVEHNHAGERFSQRLDKEFLDYLFGKDVYVGTENNELTQYVNVKLVQLLASPEPLIDMLPVMPKTVSILVNKLQSNDFHADELIELIAQEPSLAAEVIKLANSAKYNHHNRTISNLKDAFMVMGSIGMLKGVIYNYIRPFKPDTQLYFQQFGIKIWQHNQQTAAYAETLLKTKQTIDLTGVGYLVGLLRNIGHMVIYQLMVEAFYFVDPNATPSSQSFKQLILDHGLTLTLRMVQYWQLPDEIVSAIAQQVNSQHKFENIGINKVSAAVYDANLLSIATCLAITPTLSDTNDIEGVMNLLLSTQAKNLLQATN
ncbi:HDOD domain-containing protein [Colwellia sp. MEBiC06753]